MQAELHLTLHKIATRQTYIIEWRHSSHSEIEVKANFI